MIIYAVKVADGSLEQIGGAKLNPFSITFDGHGLERFAMVDGPLRAFLLIGPSTLRAWPPIQCPKIASGQAKPSSQLWANARGKVADRRPKTFAGFPLRVVGSHYELAEQAAGEPMPEISAIILRPLVPVAKLVDFELTHDGFVISFSDEPPKEALGPSKTETAWTGDRISELEEKGIVSGAGSELAASEECARCDGRGWVVGGDNEQAPCEQCSEPPKEKSDAQDVDSDEAKGSGEEPAVPRGADGGGKARKARKRRSGNGDSPPREHIASAGLSGVDGAGDDAGKGRRRSRKRNTQLGIFSGRAPAGEGDAGGAPEADLGHGDGGGALPSGRSAAWSPPSYVGPPCGVCGRPLNDEGTECARHHWMGRSRVPLYVVRYAGEPTKPPFEIRAKSSAGLRFMEAGKVYLAEECPDRPETDVWIVSDSADSPGVSYRLNENEWERVVHEQKKSVRRAASLDDL